MYAIRSYYVLAVLVVMLIFGALALIPKVGIAFGIIGTVVGILIAFVLPLLLGLINAACYEEIFNRKSKAKDA